MSVGDIVRQRILKDILDKMTDEERRDYILLSSISQEKSEIMSMLAEQGQKIDIISKKQSWLNDFSANIAANAAFETLIYLGSKILKRT